VSFVECSIVQADIKSQWQANFMQIFPTLYDELPQVHESDRECFIKFWEGDPDITYDKFMELYHPKLTGKVIGS
jgi:hypothetical protein